MQPTAPIPAPALWQQMQVSGLFLCWQWLLDGYSVGFIFFSRLCCPLRSQNSTQARLWDGFLLFGSFSSFTTPSQGQVSIPNSLSLFSSFIFCPTSFSREWAVFLGDWCPLTAFRSCFVGVAQHSNDLLVNLWQRKWFPCPISPPSWDPAPSTATAADNSHSSLPIPRNCRFIFCL